MKMKNNKMVYCSLILMALDSTHLMTSKILYLHGSLKLKTTIQSSWILGKFILFLLLEICGRVSNFYRLSLTPKRLTLIISKEKLIIFKINIKVKSKKGMKIKSEWKQFLSNKLKFWSSLTYFKNSFKTEKEKTLS